MGALEGQHPDSGRLPEGGHLGVYMGVVCRRGLGDLFSPQHTPHLPGRSSQNVWAGRP